MKWYLVVVACFLLSACGGDSSEGVSNPVGLPVDGNALEDIGEVNLYELVAVSVGDEVLSIESVAVGGQSRDFFFSDGVVAFEVYDLDLGEQQGEIVTQDKVIELSLVIVGGVNSDDPEVIIQEVGSTFEAIENGVGNVSSQALVGNLRAYIDTEVSNLDDLQRQVFSNYISAYLYSRESGEVLVASNSDNPIRERCDVLAGSYESDFEDLVGVVGLLSRNGMSEGKFLAYEAMLGVLLSQQYKLRDLLVEDCLVIDAYAFDVVTGMPVLVFRQSNSVSSEELEEQTLQVTSEAVEMKWDVRVRYIRPLIDTITQKYNKYFGKSKDTYEYDESLGKVKDDLADWDIEREKSSSSELTVQPVGDVAPLVDAEIDGDNLSFKLKEGVDIAGLEERITSGYLEVKNKLGEVVKRIKVAYSSIEKPVPKDYMVSLGHDEIVTMPLDLGDDDYGYNFRYSGIPDYLSVKLVEGASAEIYFDPIACSADGCQNIQTLVNVEYDVTYTGLDGERDLAGQGIIAVTLEIPVIPFADDIRFEVESESNKEFVILVPGDWSLEVVAGANYGLETILNPQSGSFEYTAPYTEEQLSDSFSFRFSDGSGLYSNEALAIFTVTPEEIDQYWGVYNYCLVEADRCWNLRVTQTDGDNGTLTWALNRQFQAVPVVLGKEESQISVAGFEEIRDTWRRCWYDFYQRLEVDLSSTTMEITSWSVPVEKNGYLDDSCVASEPSTSTYKLSGRLF